MNPDSWIYTIGHSTLSFADFAALLNTYKVNALCDVRSQPFSRFNPQYNRDNLKPGLASIGIKYVFLGKELGARSSDPECYVDGRVSYTRLAKTKSFNDGIERVRKGSEAFCVGLLCAERDPIECHRAILVARQLTKRGLSVAHIHTDASMETHEQLVDRLIRRTGLPDMFMSRSELEEEAYRAQERDIAYSPQEVVLDAEGVRV